MAETSLAERMVLGALGGICFRFVWDALRLDVGCDDE